MKNQPGSFNLFITNVWGDVWLFFCLLLASISFFGSKMRTNNFSFVCLQHLYPSDFFSADYLKHSPSLIFSQSMFFPEMYKKRKIWWWKPSLAWQNLSFIGGFATTYARCKRFVTWDRTWWKTVTAVWFPSFSLAVTREESNPGAQLCWWLLWRGGPAETRSRLLPASFHGKRLHRPA